MRFMIKQSTFSQYSSSCQFYMFKYLPIFITFIGSNILLARMATRRAKPDGQYHLKSEEVDDFIRNQLVIHLPGMFIIAMLLFLYKDLSGCLNSSQVTTP